MSCESVREKLTAYLDGELEGERGSAIRGHLRGCDACRAIAADEAALRDGLRSLPPVDPPASLWAGVQARLAAEEVKDAERSTWARALAWVKARTPQLALGSLALAAAVVLIVMKLQRNEEPQVAQMPPKPIRTEIKPDHNDDQVVQTNPGACNPTPSDDGDVTESIAAQPMKKTECYAQTARKLAETATNARKTWPQDRQHEFDTERGILEKAVASAGDDPGKQRAYRKLIRFLRLAVVRDDVALATIVAPGGGVQ